jgi:hypothetical protein
MKEEKGWLSKQLENCRKNVAQWPKEKKIAAGVLVPYVTKKGKIKYRDKSAKDCNLPHDETRYPNKYEEG